MQGHHAGRRGFPDLDRGRVARKPTFRRMAARSASRATRRTRRSTGNSDLLPIPVTGGTPKQITTNRAADTTPLYSPDGRYIAYSATLRPKQESDHDAPVSLRPPQRRDEEPLRGRGPAIGSYAWSADSKALYVTFEDQGQVPVARLDLATLKLTRLGTEGTAGDVDVAKDGSFLVFSKIGLPTPGGAVPARPGPGPRPLSRGATRRPTRSS